MTMTISSQNEDVLKLILSELKFNSYFSRNGKFVPENDMYFEWIKDGSSEKLIYALKIDVDCEKSNDSLNITELTFDLDKRIDTEKIDLNNIDFVNNVLEEVTKMMEIVLLSFKIKKQLLDEYENMGTYENFIPTNVSLIVDKCYKNEEFNLEFNEGDLLKFISISDSGISLEIIYSRDTDEHKCNTQYSLFITDPQMKQAVLDAVKLKNLCFKRRF